MTRIGGCGVRHSLRHLAGLALAGAALTSLFSSCGFGGSIDAGQYPYWVLNDSSSRVIVDVRADLHRTFVVPPHRYAAVYEARAPLDPKWTVAIVDDQCLAIQTWPLQETKNLVYIGPAGDRALTNDLAWSHGLRTATSVDPTERVPACQ
jgi:hypothetical protein